MIPAEPHLLKDSGLSVDNILSNLTIPSPERRPAVLTGRSLKQPTVKRPRRILLIKHKALPNKKTYTSTIPHPPRFVNNSPKKPKSITQKNKSTTEIVKRGSPRGQTRGYKKCEHPPRDRVSYVGGEPPRANSRMKNVRTSTTRTRLLRRLTLCVGWVAWWMFVFLWNGEENVVYQVVDI